MNKNRMVLRLEVKDVNSDGTFTGMASVYGNTDLGGDVVERGAFSKTLQENTAVPILWHHDPKEVIGEGVLRNTRDGLEINGKLDIGIDETAKKAYEKLKLGRMKGLSIGFQSIQDEIKNGVRHLKEIKLWEVSIVTFPMNQRATVTSVKAAVLQHKDDFLTELDAIQTWAKRYHMLSALDSSLSSIIWSNDSNEEKMTAAAESITQFSDSFLEFLPQYLALMDSMYKSAVDAFEKETGAELIAAHKARIDAAGKQFLTLLTKAAEPAPKSEPAVVPAADTGNLSALLDQFKGVLSWNN